MHMVDAHASLCCQLLLRGQRSVGSHVWATVASESVPRANNSLQGLGSLLQGLGSLRIHDRRAPHDGSASASAEPLLPTTSSHGDQHVAPPCPASSCTRAPRRTRSSMTGASLLHDKDGATPSTIPQQWPATGLGHATPIYRALCMYVPGSPLEYKREGPGPFLRRATSRKTNTPIELRTPTLLGNNASSSPRHPRRDLGLAPSLT